MRRGGGTDRWARKVHKRKDCLLRGRQKKNCQRPERRGEDQFFQMTERRGHPQEFHQKRREGRKYTIGALWIKEFHLGVWRV